MTLPETPQASAPQAPAPQASVPHAPELPPLGAPGPAATPATGASAPASPAPAPGLGGGTVDPRRLHLLREVELGISVELGRSRMTVREVLGLAPGAVVELDRPAGSPVDVLVNGTLMARGEVVVVDDEYAVRVTEVVNADPAVGLGA